MLRILFTAFAAATIAVAALAQDSAPPLFFIERIEVRNARHVPANLVISETLLRAGTEYSEEDLRAASSRLGRLILLQSADFALERGSDRGRHVLVITVAETEPFFFLLDARPIIRENEQTGQTSVEFAEHDDAESQDAAIGLRWFLGGRGVVHLGLMSRHDRHAFTADYSAAAIGYTQYDLFGTRGFATLNLRFPFDSPGEGLFLCPQVVIGLPLTTNQTLTFDFEENKFRDDQQQFQGLSINRTDRERLMSLGWTYNTTNEPFVPTSGTIIRVAALRTLRDRRSFRISTAPRATITELDAWGIDFLASRYWELTERDSVSAGLLGGSAQVESRTRSDFTSQQNWEPAYLNLRGAYSRSLWRGDPRRGDSRVELEARYAESRLNFEHPPDSSDDEEDVWSLSVSWVRRSSWGAVRIGVGYGWEK